MNDYTKKLGEFLEEYISIHSISFSREDPKAFASRIFKAFSPFFFPPGEANILEGLKEKALCSLWNVVIDDVIEYTDRGGDNILDSFEVLIESKKGKNFKAKTEAGQIMNDFIQRFYGLPSGPNKKISEELVFLDLIRILNGFDYERIIHENDTMGTLSEYMEFGALTIDLRTFLDIDIAIHPFELSIPTIGDIREAYKWFGMAFKLSSDIATFEREYFVEASQNAIILYGQEKGLLPRDVLRAGRKYKEQLFEEVIPLLMSEIGDKAKEYLSKSMKYLDSISEIDTSSISTAFKSMCEKYPGHTDFLFAAR